MMNNSTTPSITQQQRVELIARALWFSADHYVPVENELLICIRVDEAAHHILGMLDDMEQLKALPIEG